MSRRPRIVVRRFVTVAAASAAAVTGLVLAGPAAPAAALASALPTAISGGACTTNTGVTVVIDYAELGGGVQVSCVDPFSGDGADALSASGNTPTGVARWGLAFICRINGRPSATEGLAIAGSEGYQEKCVNTPPASAFWSYWHAPNGGSWTFSQQGAKSRQAIPGGFEGWRFSLNGSAANPIPPNYRPSHPVVAPQPPPPPAPAAPPAPPPAAGGGGGTTSGGTSGTTGSSAGSGSSSTSGGTQPGTTAAPGTTPEGSPEASPDASASPSEVASASPSVSESPIADAKGSTPRASAVAKATDSSSALPTVLVLVGLLGTGAAAWWVRFRRRSTP